MTDIPLWPSLNAGFNALSACFLLAGRLLIARGNRAMHRAAMLGALGSSIAFLVSYVLYHLHVGSVRFRGAGTIRVVYLLLLTSHSILAVVIVPMVVVTLLRALRSQFDRHIAIAPWTFFLWLYVSVTGVTVYLFLYCFYPQPPL